MPEIQGSTSSCVTSDNSYYVNFPQKINNSSNTLEKDTKNTNTVDSSIAVIYTKGSTSVQSPKATYSISDIVTPTQAFSSNITQIKKIESSSPLAKGEDFLNKRGYRADWDFFNSTLTVDTCGVSYKYVLNLTKATDNSIKYEFMDSKLYNIVYKPQSLVSKGLTWSSLPRGEVTFKFEDPSMLYGKNLTLSGGTQDGSLLDNGFLNSMKCSTVWDKKTGNFKFVLNGSTQGLEIKSYKFNSTTNLEFTIGYADTQPPEQEEEEEEDSPDILNMAKNLLLGIGDAVEATANGVWEAVTHPVETVEGIRFLTNGLRLGTKENLLLSEIVKQAVIDAWDDFREADDDKKSRMIGRALGEVILGLIGTKGTELGLDALKASSRSGKLAGWLSKIERGASNADELVSSLNGAAETVEKLRNGVNRNISDILGYTKSIVKNEAYYDFITNEGLVVRIEKSKISDTNKLDEIADNIISKEGVNTLQQLSRQSVDDKLARYLLNLEHPVGGSKAKWFRDALGFTQENADDLARQIVFNPNKAVQTAITEHGIKYNQVISIKGVNGKIIDVTFGWIKNNDGVVRLVTGIPTKK